MKLVENISPRILYVDDDQLSAMAFADRLERRGFSVEVVLNGKEALSRLAVKTYDLVLLDIVMPEIDGLTLLKEIRRNHSVETLPIIMVTMIDGSTDIQEAFECGANDYITKPLNIEAASARVNGQLNLFKLNQTLARLKEAEAVAAMVVTYHHELNNPLAIIKGELELMIQAGMKKPARIQNIFAAFDRISETLSKIKSLTEKNHIEFEPYTNTSKMVKIK